LIWTPVHPKDLQEKEADVTAVTRTLFMEQGITWQYGFTYYQPGPLDDDGLPTSDPYDLSGCFARMQVREKKGLTVLIYATSETDASAGANRIFLNDVGRVEIELTDQDTEMLTMKKAVYDLELVWPLELGAPDDRRRVDRLLMGTIEVSLAITQDDPSTVVNEDEAP
jgi:hypothetical protein